MSKVFKENIEVKLFEIIKTNEKNEEEKLPTED